MYAVQSFHQGKKKEQFKEMIKSTKFAFAFKPMLNVCEYLNTTVL